MPALLLTALFWIAASAIVVGQAMILRSTVRAWRLDTSSARRATTEWLFAVVPAVVLGLVLWRSWLAVA